MIDDWEERPDDGGGALGGLVNFEVNDYDNGISIDAADSAVLLSLSQQRSERYSEQQSGGSVWDSSVVKEVNLSAESVKRATFSDSKLRLSQSSTGDLFASAVEEVLEEPLDDNTDRVLSQREIERQKRDSLKQNVDLDKNRRYLEDFNDDDD